MQLRMERYGTSIPGQAVRLVMEPFGPMPRRGKGFFSSVVEISNTALIDGSSD